jgi:putative endopeptidase
VINELSSENRKVLIESLPHDSVISQLYYSGLTPQNGTDGLVAVKHLLDLVGPIATLKDVWNVVAKIEQEQLDASFFTFLVSVDSKNASFSIPTLKALEHEDIEQDNHHNPGEDKPPTTTGLKNKYENYLKSLFALAGYSDQDSAKHASNQVNLEKQLQKMVHETKQPSNTSFKKSLSELTSEYPNINFEIYFDILGVRNFGAIDVPSPYLRKLSDWLAKLDIAIVKSFLTGKILKAAAPYVGDSYYKEYHKFVSIIAGSVPKSKESRVINVVSVLLSDPVSKLYSESIFSPLVKKEAVHMVHYILISYKKMFERSNWLADSTKQSALEKLAKIDLKIGYPDTFKDYSALEGKISKDNLFLTNIAIIRQFNFKMNQIDRINKPVDKTAWTMAPYVSNAQYNTVKNEITYPIVNNLINHRPNSNLHFSFRRHPKIHLEILL